MLLEFDFFTLVCLCVSVSVCVCASMCVSVIVDEKILSGKKTLHFKYAHTLRCSSIPTGHWRSLAREGARVVAFLFTIPVTTL